MNNTERATVELIINGTQATASMRDLEAAARKVKSEMRGMMPGTPEFASAAANLQRINGELNNVRVEAGLTKSSFDKLKDTVKGVFVGTLGSNLAMAGLTKITEYIGNAWNAALKLSDQMTDIGRTTGLTTEEVKALNKELSQINTRTSTNDLREMAIVAGQFGVAKDQIAGFVESVDRVNIVMGSEFGGNAEAVATEMSKIRNVFTDIKTDNIGADIGFISNAINKLAQDGVATAPVVADLANRIGGYGIQVGLTSGQVLGLSATLQELNVSSERGGTAVVKILQKMLTNTEDFAKIAGVEINQFKTMLNDDLYGAFAKVMEGSKKMGSSSTLLAGIVKELEVQGAGASEVFAKLGANTELLSQKTEMASKALTNTNSISEQAKEKQENLAGTVAQLGKSWDKLTNNPAIVGFFTGLIKVVDALIGGLEQTAKVLHVVWDYFATMGALPETIRRYQARVKQQTDEFNAEILAKEKEAMETRVAGAVNGYKQLTDAELKHQVEKLAAINKGNFDYARELIAAGKSKEAMLYIQQSREDVLNYNAAKKEYDNRQTNNKKTLEQKQELTKEMLKEQDKQHKEEAKLQKEAITNWKKQNDEYWKQVVAGLDADIKEAEKYWDKKDALFLKKMQETWDKTKQFWADEMNARLDFNLITATTDEQKYAAQLEKIQVFYAEKIALVKKGSEQEKLLTAQLAHDVAELDKQKKLKQLNEARNVYGEIQNVASAFANAITQQETNEQRRKDKAHESEKQKLKKQLDSKLISQEQYDAKLAAINAKQEAEQKALIRKQAERQKMFAIFDSVIKTALAWIEASLDYSKIPAAIAATVQSTIIAATPIPEFYDGGYTGNGGNLDSKGGFAAILHPNEYVVNAQAMQNPMVNQMVKAIETGQINNITNNSISNVAPSTGNGKLEQLLEHLVNNGINAEMVFDDERLSKLKIREQKKAVIDKTLSA